MSYRIDSYKSNTLRSVLLLTISGVIIYFFILDYSEKEVVHYWLSEIQRTAFYGLDIFYNLFNTYLW